MSRLYNAKASDGERDVDDAMDNEEALGPNQSHSSTTATAASGVFWV